MKDGGLRNAVGWGLLDQALSSGTNFALVAAVARTASPTNFGVFALILGGFTLVLGLSRAACGEPLGSQRAVSTTDPTLANGAAALAVMMGCFCSLVLFVGLVIVPPALQGATAVLAVACPFLLYQDLGRYIHFSNTDPILAVGSDCSWAALQFATTVILLRFGVHSATMYMLSWAIGGMFAGTAFRTARLKDMRRSAMAAYWDALGTLSRPYVLEYGLISGSSQLTSIIVTLTCGLPALAALKAIQTLFGPVFVLLNGTRVALVPYLSRALRRSLHEFRRGVVVVALLGAGCAATAGVALSRCPPRWGRSILGDSWVLAVPLVAPITVQYIALGLADGAFASLRSLGHGVTSLKLRVWMALTTLPLTVVLGFVYHRESGIAGVSWGFAASALAALPVCFVASRRALARYEDATYANHC